VSDYQYVTTMYKLISGKAHKWELPEDKEINSFPACWQIQHRCLNGGAPTVSVLQLRTWHLSVYLAGLPPDIVYRLVNRLTRGRLIIGLIRIS
jgi:hypothetical protein